MRDRWLASWIMVSIYISRKNIPCHTIVGLCPPISTSGPSKNVSISAGSGFAGPTLPLYFFLGGGGFIFIVNFNSKSNSKSNSNSNSNPNSKSNSKSNSNSNSNPNSMVRDSLVGSFAFYLLVTNISSTKNHCVDSYFYIRIILLKF